MIIIPSVYSRQYFLESCDGFELWEVSFGRQLPPRLAYSLKIADLKKGEKVLDFGCGRGEMVIQAAMKGCDTIGIDYSSEAIILAKEASKKNKIRAKILLVKDGKLPFTSEVFDCVFFLDVAEHLTDDQLITVFKEIRRVLRPDGRLIIHTSPNKDWIEKGYRFYTRYANFLASKLIWEPFFKTRLSYQENPRTMMEKKVHINEQTTQDLRKNLAEAGFIKINLWLDSTFRITGKGFWFQYTFLQPLWLPFLGKYFASDIWWWFIRRIPDSCLW